jgi:hypothetical protein
MKVKGRSANEEDQNEAVAYFKVLSKKFQEDTRKTKENSVRMVSLNPENRTLFLLNTIHNSNNNG